MVGFVETLWKREGLWWGHVYVVANEECGDYSI